MKLTTPITRLLDAGESRGFVGSPNERRAYGLNFPNAFTMRFLNRKKVANGKYFISRGFVEGLSITGSGQVLDTVADGVLGVQVEFTRQLATYNGEENAISYYTGKYNLISAVLFMSRSDDLSEENSQGEKAKQLFIIATTNADGDFTPLVGGVHSGGFTGHIRLDPTLNL